MRIFSSSYLNCCTTWYSGKQIAGNKNSILTGTVVSFTCFFVCRAYVQQQTEQRTRWVHQQTITTAPRQPERSRARRTTRSNAFPAECDPNYSSLRPMYSLRKKVGLVYLPPRGPPGDTRNCFKLYLSLYAETTPTSLAHTLSPSVASPSIRPNQPVLLPVCFPPHRRAALSLQSHPSPHKTLHPGSPHCEVPPRFGAPPSSPSRVRFPQTLAKAGAAMV